MIGSRIVRAGAVVAVLALPLMVGVACGNSGTKNTHAAAVPVSSVDNPSSTLRAGLTALLQEHVYLAGIATGEALGGHDLAPPAAALDKNSVALGDAIASIYGRAAGDQFLALWRTHITFFVDYTKGLATNNQAMVAKARADLDQYRSDFGAFLAAANPNLTKDAVANELIPHVQSLFAAINAQAAKSPEAFEKLRLAASHMPMTADILAGAIAKQKHLA